MDAKTLKTVFEIGETIAVEFKRCGIQTLWERN